MKITKKFIEEQEKELTKLLKVFLSDVYVKCVDFYNAYSGDNALVDEVVTYRYKFQIVVTSYQNDKFYSYEGWCYESDLKKVAVGIFSHWLVSNYKIYDGKSTALYNMYVGSGNLVKKEQ